MNKNQTKLLKTTVETGHDSWQQKRKKTGSLNLLGGVMGE